MLALLTCSAPAALAQSWFWVFDGSMAPDCAPSQDGNNAFWLRPTDLPDYPNLYWEIYDVPSAQQVSGQSKALRIYDNVSVPDTTTAQGMIRWMGAGSRPEHYKGTCNGFANPNFVPGNDSMTLTMRFRIDNFDGVSENPRRFFNLEFETTRPKPTPTDATHTTYMFKFEPTYIRRNTSTGALTLEDRNLTGHSADQFGTVRTSGGVSHWVKMWARMRIPATPIPGYTSDTDYEMWIDHEDGGGWKQYTWWHRDKGGWTDVELGSLGNPSKSTVLFDYICYTYGDYALNSIPIPGERDSNTPLVPVPGFDKNKIAHVKLQPDGYPVDMTGKVVTGVYTDPTTTWPFYYIEDADKSAGVKVYNFTGKNAVNTGGTEVTLAVGDVVSIKGGINSANCEKQIASHYILRTATGASPAKAVGLTNKAIQLSFNSDLAENASPQLLDSPEAGVITNITTCPLPWVVNPAWSYCTCSRITVSGKNWSPGQWMGYTLCVPATDLYFTIVDNTADTITLTRPSFLVHLDIASSAYNVQVGDSILLPGTGERGLSAAGLRVNTWGRVSDVNATTRTFYIEDGSGMKENKTLQDIMIPYNPATDSSSYSLYFPPNGLRVYLPSGTMPVNGDYVLVHGCLGNYQHRFTAWATLLGTTGRDDTKESKVMPVVWAQTWTWVAH